jgi:hypothetical protein
MHVEPGRQLRIGQCGQAAARQCEAERQIRIGQRRDRRARNGARHVGNAITEDALLNRDIDRG